MWPIRILLLCLRVSLRDRADLAAENLALRQQLAALAVRLWTFDLLADAVIDRGARRF